MTSLVIGLGEIGSALYEVLRDTYGDDKVFGYDAKDEGKVDIFSPVGMLHICIPYSKNFIPIVKEYKRLCEAKYVVIHSSVPVGVTEMLGEGTFHSPVRGKHPHMKEGLLTYVKYLSFNGMDLYDAQEIADYMHKAGISTKTVTDTKTTELGKLLALCRYGVYIAFAKEQEKICERFGVAYHKAVTDFERTRNEGLEEIEHCELKQPLLFPFQDYVGGHCTVEDMEILLKQYATPLLFKAYEIDRATKVWGNCNIYPTAKIGKGCSIGNGSEIGNNVVIGNNVRIGAHCFLPEGVTIEDDCFIAPKVTVSNDKHPPSKDKSAWGTVVIKKGATIGMGAIILPDVVIGENALVGAGAIVTKNIPDGEVWYGHAAYAHGRRGEEDDE